MRKLRKITAAFMILMLVFVLPADVYAAGAARHDQIGPGAALLGGAEILMLKSSSDSQMMGYVITTVNGGIIVVDGGLDVDAPHLKEILKSKGSHVNAWLITHPHSDHVGAITSIINEGLDGISIDGIYYNYTDIDWYRRNEAYRADMVAQSMEAFYKMSPAVLHSNIKKDDIINVDDVQIKVMNEPYLFNINAINNSSVVYRMDIGGKRVLFLGDLGEQGGNSLIKDTSAEELKADIVQMAHHGQYGVGKEVYELIRPEICMWNAPEWLWNNDNGGGIGSGNWLTLEVRGWMDELGARRNYCIKDGDQIIK